MKMLIVGNGWILEDRGELVVGLRTRDFLHACGRHFDDTTYLCSSPPRSSEGCNGAALDPALIHAVPLPTRGSRPWSKVFSYARNLGRIWRTVRDADFLYVFFPGTLSLLASAIARILHKPYGVYVRGEGKKNSRLWRRTLCRAQFVITSGETLAEAARSCCRDVELVVPMCPLPFDGAPPREPPRDHGPWRLLYVGRLETPKGTLDLLEAAAILRDRGIDFQLDLVGENRMNPVPDCVASLGDRIRFAGVIRDDDRLRRYYRDADLFCFPSHYEGFPRVLYEAMAHGVPVVTTFVGSISSVMRDGVNCLRVDIGSPRQLADAVERALASAELRKNLADQGRITMEPILRHMREESHDKQLARKVREKTQ